MSNIYRKTSVYLGVTLIGIGVIFNKSFIELTIVPGKNIDAPIYQIFDFASFMPQDKRYWADGRHVNEESTLVKARLFAEFIHSLGIIR